MKELDPDEELFVPYCNLTKVIHGLTKTYTKNKEDQSSLANWFRKELSDEEFQGEYETEEGLEEGVFITGNILTEMYTAWNEEQTAQAIRSLVNDGLVDVLWDSDQNDFVFKAVTIEE